ncbi:Leucine Rich repeat [Novymonas esmeraldas]|uniref:Leucine Rich repeat n=1 Tax=Novymonas esmeraldas TaxID=1808958 RepID=A0AAW0F5J7_9TRYP
MGATLQAALRQIRGEGRWHLDELAALPDLEHMPDTPWSHDVRHTLPVAAYATECLDAYRREEDMFVEGGALRWRVPEHVCVADQHSGDDPALTRALLDLLSQLSRVPLVSLSLQGHTEVTADTVRCWASRLQRVCAPTASSPPAWCGLRVLDLCDCSLGDGGVRLLLSALYPPHDPPSATPRRAPLPHLESILLDGVGVTDSCASWAASLLTNAAQQVDKVTPTGGDADHSTVSPSRPPATATCPLRRLSLQRNALCGVGLLDLLRSSLTPPSNAVAAVDVSWNSLSWVTYTNCADTAAAARCDAFASLGAALGRPHTSAGWTPDGSATPLRGPLLLRGCDVTGDDIRALCTTGLTSAFLDTFRDAARAAMRHSPNSSPRSPPHLVQPCAQLTKVDLSYNPLLGDRGVRQLLSAIVCLEATSAVFHSPVHRGNAVAHALGGLTELHLRGVGCTDAVLADVLRLLRSTTGDAAAPAATVGAAVADDHATLMDTEVVLLEEVQRTVLNEALLLAQVRQSEETAVPHHTSGAAPAPPFVYAPSLRVLDLSENEFSSAALVGAVLASAALRRCTVASSPRVSDTGGAVGHAFAVGMEDCRISDAALTHVRLFAEAVPPEMTDSDGTRPTSCTWFLGGNQLTHSAVLRLRSFAAATHAGGSSAGRWLRSVNVYVERNAILHPATAALSAEEEEEEVEEQERGTAAALLGLTPADPAGHRVTGTSAAEPLRASVLHDAGAARVSWHQLPRLPAHASADVVDARCYSSAERASRVDHLARGTTRLQSLCSSATDADVSASAVSEAADGLVTRAGRVGVRALRGSSEAEALASTSFNVNGSGDSSAAVVVGHQDSSGVWSTAPSTMTGSTADYIDAFIAEAEQVMRERRHFLAEMDRQMTSAEEVASLLSLPSPGLSSGTGLTP